MGSKSSWYFLQFLIICLHCSSSSLVHGFNDTFSQSLESILRDHAFATMFHPRPQTGEVYKASLPANLAGMTISVVRLRSRTLYRKGANFSDFHIPPRTLPKPYVKRLFIVYHDLGNWSSYYYNITGYTLITSVVGFLVYDASSLSDTGLRKLDLDTMGKPISIQFHNSSLPGDRRTKCVAFNANGKVHLSDIVLQNVCCSRSQGHFSIVMPTIKKKRKENMWGLWMIGFFLGFAALVFVALVGVVFFRVLSSKRRHEMEKEASEGEVLETVSIHGSKLPRAAVTRSHPTLESTGFP